MALTQTHFRFRTDGNAVDATPTWGADEDASPNPATTPFRLRLGLNSTAAASGEFEIYAQKNAGSYAAITISATGGIQSYDASPDADDTILRVPRLSMSVAWWLAGAAIDLDFAGNRIYPSGAFTDYLSCSRASDGYAKNLAGSWVQFAPNELRITNRGLLREDARTNYLLQSASPATQTTESLSTGSYTLWVEGTGSALASGGTATITGASAATDGAPNTFTVTIAGTVDVTVTGSLTIFQLENGTFASSYIATTTASAARAADVVTHIGDASTLLKQVTNSMLFHSGILPSTQSWNMPFVYFSGLQLSAAIEGVADNRVISWNGSVDREAIFGSGTILTADTYAGFAFDGSGRSVVANGGTVGTDANTNSLQTTDPIMSISSYGNPFAYLKRATFWNTRLSDSTLQTLTAP